MEGAGRVFVLCVGVEWGVWWEMRWTRNAVGGSSRRGQTGEGEGRGGGRCGCRAEACRWMDGWFAVKGLAESQMQTSDG